jgi:hypothetical protein
VESAENFPAFNFVKIYPRKSNIKFNVLNLSDKVKTLDLLKGGIPLISWAALWEK